MTVSGRLSTPTARAARAGVAANGPRNDLVAQTAAGKGGYFRPLPAIDTCQERPALLLQQGEQPGRGEAPVQKEQVIGLQGGQQRQQQFAFAAAVAGQIGLEHPA